jgi:hypothetical protein
MAVLSRRNVMTVTSMLAARAVPIAAAIVADQYLMCLCEEWMETEAIFDREDDVPRDELGVAMERRRQIRDTLRNLPAETDQGRRAEARVLLTELAVYGSSGPSEPSQYVAWSLAQDILRAG